MIETTGKIYSFGLGANGQLGTSTTTNQKIPAPVHGGWLSSNTLQEEGDLIDFGTPVDLVPLAEHGFVVKRVFAGGDQSFASVIVNKMGAKVHVQVASLSFFPLFSFPLPTAPSKNSYSLSSPILSFTYFSSGSLRPTLTLFPSLLPSSSFLSSPHPPLSSHVY